MRKLLYVLVLAAAGVQAGIYSTTNVYGVTTITSPLEAFPLGVTYGMVTNGTETALVTNLLETANLEEGDQLMVWNDETYDIYELQSNRTWKGVSDLSKATPDPATARAKFGTGAWLVRTNAATRADRRIILRGQVPAGDVAVAIGTGTTLVAVPFSEEVNLNETGVADWETFTPNAKDRIRYYATNGVMRVYRWDSLNKKWYMKDAKGNKVTTCPIGNGCAFWYVRAAGAGAGTLTWHVDRIGVTEEK